jgi:hypothetical protein
MIEISQYYREPQDEDREWNKEFSGDGSGKKIRRPIFWMRLPRHSP